MTGPQPNKFVATFQTKQISVFANDDVRILLLNSALSVPQRLGLRDEGEREKPMPTRGGCV